MTKNSLNHLFWTGLLSLGLFFYLPLPVKAGEWCGSREQSTFAKLSAKLAEDYFPTEGYFNRRARFIDGCKAHDECYWYLDSGRKKCDENLRKMLIESCENTFNEGIYLNFLPSCKDEAETYYLTTKIFGGGSYYDSQNEAKQVLTVLETHGINKTPKILSQISELCPLHTDQDGICLINFVAEQIANNTNSKKR
jgi:hypothetical protein